jgi:hypothetical protein
MRDSQIHDAHVVKKTQSSRGPGETKKDGGRRPDPSDMRFLFDDDSVEEPEEEDYELDDAANYGEYIARDIPEDFAISHESLSECMQSIASEQLQRKSENAARHRVVTEAAGVGAKLNEIRTDIEETVAIGIAGNEILTDTGHEELPDLEDISLSTRAPISGNNAHVSNDQNRFQSLADDDTDPRDQTDEDNDLQDQSRRPDPPTPSTLASAAGLLKLKETPRNAEDTTQEEQAGPWKQPKNRNSREKNQETPNATARVNPNVPVNAATPVNSSVPASSVDFCTQLFSTIARTPPADKPYGYTTSSSDSPESNESSGSGSKSPSIAKSSSSSDRPYKNVRGRVTGTQASKDVQDQRGRPKGQTSTGKSKPRTGNQSEPPVQDIGRAPVPNPYRDIRQRPNRGQRNPQNAGRTQTPQGRGSGGQNSRYKNTKNRQSNRQNRPDFR